MLETQDYFSYPEDEFDHQAVGLSDLFDQFCAGDDAPKDRPKPSLSDRTEGLKDIFDSMACLAWREIDIALEFNEHLGMAINRTQFIIDIMSDATNPNAPQLVRSGELNRSEATIWKPLQKHRDGLVEDLKGKLELMQNQESALIMRSQRKAPPPLRLIHSN